MDLRLYHRGGDIWDAMYNDCQAATVSILLDQYILEPDNAGNRFLELFEAKARAGLDVTLKLDRIGSRKLFKSAQIERLVTAGCKVSFYNPISWFNIFLPKTWFPRNHVKALLVDGKIVYIGSACMDETMRNWRELHARIAFETPEDLKKSLPRHAPARPLPRFYGVRQSIPDDPMDIYLTDKKYARHIYRELLIRIGTAKKEICFATPYLMPPTALKHACLRAMKRGVKLHVIVTRKSDVPLASLVAQSYFSRMIKHGARLYFFEGEVLHAKYAYIDDDWAMLGSTNIDYLSLILNREANLLLRRPDTVEMVRARFENDLQQSTPVSKNYWSSVPWPLKFMGYMGRILKKVI